MRCRIFAQRRVVDRTGDLSGALDVVPRIHSFGPHSWLAGRDALHLVDWFASLGPIHVGKQCEVKAASPQPCDRNVDFAVVESLKSKSEIHHSRLLPASRLLVTLVNAEDRFVITRQREHTGALGTVPILTGFGDGG